MRFLKENNFYYPRSVSIKRTEDIKKIDFMPVVIKPSVGSGGSKDIMIAQSESELEFFCKYLLNLYPEFMAQEYLGTPDSEYTVGVLSSMDGGLINSIAVKRSIMSALNNRLKVKNSTGNLSFGSNLVISNGISEGLIGPFPEVTKECEKIAKKLGSTGAINLQCRLVDGKIYVFEINPQIVGNNVY